MKKRILYIVIIIFALAYINQFFEKDENPEDITENKTEESEITTEYNEISEDRNTYDNEDPEENKNAESIDYYNLSEEEYKESCIELYYDDVFFGEDDLCGNIVKIHLMLSEKYYFTDDDYYKDSFIQYNEKYNLNKDFYKCCVLRESSNSYVGQQIDMWFSNDFQLNPSDYDVGQKIIVYAEVIQWNDNTTNGYNSITIIPRYIESEE